MARTRTIHLLGSVTQRAMADDPYTRRGAIFLGGAALGGVAGLGTGYVLWHEEEPLPEEQYLSIRSDVNLGPFPDSIPEYLKRTEFREFEIGDEVYTLRGSSPAVSVEEIGSGDDDTFFEVDEQDSITAELYDAEELRQTIRSDIEEEPDPFYERRLSEDENDTVELLEDRSSFNIELQEVGTVNGIEIDENERYDNDIYAVFVLEEV